MTKYVVSGYIGFDNFGDEAIAKVLTEKLKNEGAEKITLISSNPEKTSKRYGVQSCGMLKFIPALKDADVLISGGGSLLQDATSLKSLVYYIGVIAFALVFGKKVIIYAQGIGPINSSLGRFMTKFALKQANEITVRDNKSQQLLEAWGIKSELVKDPIFSLDIPQRNNVGYVGVQLRSCQGLTEDFLRVLAKKLAAKYSDKAFQIISLQDRLDVVVCRQFEKYLKEEGVSDVQILEGLDFEDVINAISNLEFLVGMRFHANVVAIKAGVKTVAINYDPKVQKLAEEYKLPLIELNQQDFDF